MAETYTYNGDGTWTVVFTPPSGYGDRFVYRQGVGYPPPPPTEDRPDDDQISIRNQRVTTDITRIDVGLVRWDTSSLPNDAEIESATLRVSVASKNNRDGRSLRAQRSNWTLDVLGAWNESVDGDLFDVPLASIPLGESDLPLGQRKDPDTYIDRKGDLEIRLGLQGGLPTGLNLLSLTSYNGTPSRSPRLVLTYRRATQTISPPHQTVGATVHIPEVLPQPVAVELPKQTIGVKSGATAGLSFDGVDDGIEVPHSSLINDDTFTEKGIELHVTTGSDVQATQILYEQGGVTHGYNLQISSGMLHFNQWRDGGVPHTVSTPISPDRTYWLTLVHDGNAVGDKLLGYVNAALAGTVAGLASVPPHGKAQIGRIQSNTLLADGSSAFEPDYAFSGIVHEYRHWSTAPSQAQIQANMHADLSGNEPGLAPLYKLDEGSGTVATDSSPNNLDGTIAGATWKAGDPYGVSYVGLVVKPPHQVIGVTLYAPTVSGGTVTVQPPHQAVGVTLYAPEIFPQAVTVDVERLSAGTTIYIPRVELSLKSIAVQRRTEGLMLSGDRGTVRYEPHLFLSNVSGDEIRQLPNVISAAVNLSNFRDHTWELSLECEATDAFDPLSDYVLAALDVSTAMDPIRRYYLGLYRFFLPEADDQPEGRYWSLAGMSPEMLLIEDVATTGWRVAAGTNVMTAVRDVIASVGVPASRISLPPSTKTVPAGLYLDPIKDGEEARKIRIANKLLSIAGYEALQTTKEGQFFAVEAQPLSKREASAHYGPPKAGDDMLLRRGIPQRYSADGFANEVLVKSQDPNQEPQIVGIARNEDPASPVSIPRLGREVTQVVTATTLADQQVADRLAEAELERSSAAHMKRTIATMPDPRRGPGESYEVDAYNARGEHVVEGKWTVVNWQLPLDREDPGEMVHEISRTARFEEELIGK